MFVLLFDLWARMVGINEILTCGISDVMQMKIINYIESKQKQTQVFI